MAQRTCSIERCPNKHYGRGLCNMHWQRWRKTGNAGSAESTQFPKMPECIADDCDRPPRSLGLCTLHYQRQYDAGGRSGQPCSIEGCPKPRSAYGWCARHYQLWRTHGDPTMQVKASPGQGSYFTKDGYRFVNVKGRWMAEHRHVMEQALGRPLLPGENVHHKDGDRARNDIDNLELWVTGQPKGQRVADLLAFVVERYPEQVARMLRQQRQGKKPTEHPTLW